MRSREGASYRLLQTLGTVDWRPNLSVAVLLEYESVLKRNCNDFDLSEQDIDDLLNGICSKAGLHRLYFSWRTVTSDPEDDFLLESAIASRSDFIISYNKRHLKESLRFEIQCLSPEQMRTLVGEL